MAKYTYELIHSDGNVRARLSAENTGIVFESWESDSLESNLTFEDGWTNHKLDIMTLANHLKEKQILFSGDIIDFPEARVDWVIE